LHKKIALFKIFGFAPQDIEQLPFFDYLKHYFSHPNYSYKQASYLAFEAFVELKSFEEAFSSWLTMKKRKEKPLFMNEYENILDVVSSKLQYEHHRFNEKDLNSIEEAINTILKLKTVNMGEPIWKKCHRIREQINEIQYIGLKSELEGVNLEINADKERVIEKIRRFGFSDELTGALNKIDELYRDITSDEFDWAMANGRLREFLAQLLKESSYKIYDKTGDEITRAKRESALSSFKSYIKKHLSLDDEENQLINAIIGITNSKGAHTLITEKEYFRLCKNMIIELSLLLTSKLERFLEDN